MLPWELEDWLTNEGDRIVRKTVAATDESVLDDRDRLIYELWLFDTEQRNGGVSQYFCNHGLEQWKSLSRLAAPALPSFVSFASRVNSVVLCCADPYRAVIDSTAGLDHWYEQHQIQLVDELREAVRPAR